MKICHFVFFSSKLLTSKQKYLQKLQHYDQNIIFKNHHHGNWTCFSCLNFNTNLNKILKINFQTAELLKKLLLLFFKLDCPKPFVLLLLLLLFELVKYRHGIFSSCSLSSISCSSFDVTSTYCRILLNLAIILSF